MLLSMDWLREFTPFAGDVEELAERLTMMGLEVEDVYHPFPELADVVVGRVVECAPHPDADTLSVTRVDVGDEVLDIVCGAPNVAAGQLVPVGRVGATLPGGTRLKKARIRGRASHGMILSGKEMALSEDSSGIMVLDEGPAVGTGFVEAVGLETSVLDISITPNRADCLSVLGLAREVAMACGLPLTIPGFELSESGRDAAAEYEIRIDDPALCPAYRARVIEDVTVGPSPAWLRHRLLAVGLRPINNLVDVTNYILMELGQPMHAFDRDLMSGGVIRVARAEEGMRFTTLDDQERTLCADDLLIWDGEKPVGLAGVMGGANTEIHDRSTGVVLECAVFDPPTIRRTARRLAIPSEASYRFERGVDQLRSPLAMDKGAAMMAELAGGRVLPGVAMAEPRPWRAPDISFRPSRARLVLGMDVGDEFCRQTLESLGCQVAARGGDFDVVPPSHRLDIEREVDLVEEVGRVYGLDRIPAELPRVSRSLAQAASPETEWDFLMRLKQWGRSVGLREAINYSFVGTADLDAFGLSHDDRVAVANPLSEEQNVLRTVLAPGLVRSLANNVSQGQAGVRLFEVARVFHADKDSETGARESNRLGVLLAGNRFGGFPWAEARTDYADLKGCLESLLTVFNLPEAGFEIVESTWLSPCVLVRLDGLPLGVMGRLSGSVAEAYKIRRTAWVAELDLEKLRRAAADREITFTELDRFPPVRRDMTLVMPQGLSVDRVVGTVRETGEMLLSRVRVIDEFVPEGGGERNVTFRLTYRHPSRTLKDKEVDKIHNRLRELVTDRLPVSLQ